jgi:uncharacterized protein
MITRILGLKIAEMARKFPVIAITGPRQSGKTTLCKQVFPDYTYVSLENPDDRAFAENDPRGFLETYSSKVIIDEVQHVPQLFSYIQSVVDASGESGQFILTGSQNFLLLEKISQSLAGRVYISHLLPFSRKELAAKSENDLNAVLFKGGYPRIFDREIEPSDFFPSYVQTYIERDIRSIYNVRDLSLFSAFLRLCAGRTGQLFNASSIGNELGVDYKTIQNWISILETSFILFKLEPWHVNFNKRVVKTPKYYFYDTGLAAYLLGIRKPDEISVHFAKGMLFENYCISEYLKNQWNQGQTTRAFFWRDNVGNEIDLLIEKGNDISVAEIKSGQTIKDDFFKGLTFMEKYAQNYQLSKFLIYGGEQSRKQYETQVLSWKDLEQLD